MSTSCNCSVRNPAANSCQERRGTQQMPDVLQPRPTGAGHGGRPQCERKRFGVSGGSSPNSLPSLHQSDFWIQKSFCGIQCFFRDTQMFLTFSEVKRGLIICLIVLDILQGWVFQRSVTPKTTAKAQTTSRASSKFVQTSAQTAPTSSKK